jgi:hypothetical protein
MTNQTIRNLRITAEDACNALLDAAGGILKVDPELRHPALSEAATRLHAAWKVGKRALPWLSFAKPQRGRASQPGRTAKPGIIQGNARKERLEGQAAPMAVASNGQRELF